MGRSSLEQGFEPATSRSELRVSAPEPHTTSINPAPAAPRQCHLACSLVCYLIGFYFRPGQIPSRDFRNSSFCHCHFWLRHRSLQNCLADLRWSSGGGKLVADNSDCIRLSVMAADGNYASTDNVQTQESWRNYFITGTDAPDVYASKWFSKHLFTESNGASTRDSSCV